MLVYAFPDVGRCYMSLKRLWVGQETAGTATSIVEKIVFRGCMIIAEVQW